VAVAALPGAAAMPTLIDSRADNVTQVRQRSVRDDGFTVILPCELNAVSAAGSPRRLNARAAACRCAGKASQTSKNAHLKWIYPAAAPDDADYGQ
jgi:hypothetical protein